MYLTFRDLLGLDSSDRSKEWWPPGQTALSCTERSPLERSRLVWAGGEPFPARGWENLSHWSRRHENDMGSLSPSFVRVPRICFPFLNQCSRFSNRHCRLEAQLALSPSLWQEVLDLILRCRRP